MGGPQGVASLYNLKLVRRRSAAGGVQGMRKTTYNLNSASNYTPMLLKDGSVGSAKTGSRFKRRLGTEPFILSEGQMRTHTAGFTTSNAMGGSSQSTAACGTFVGSEKHLNSSKQQQRNAGKTQEKLMPNMFFGPPNQSGTINFYNTTTTSSNLFKSTKPVMDKHYYN